jgi:2-polyprenyl-6-methoxyphenol hydroxylase-like FAD-dependent oxidoreductase
MRVLVVGGGIGGLTAATALARQNAEVELVERQADVSAAGAGMTLLNPALRALDQLDLLEGTVANGFPMEDMEFCDAQGTMLNRVVTGDSKATGRPGHVGILRRSLRDLLQGAAVAAGARIRLGTTASVVEAGDGSVKVALSDGELETYDLVVGADGIHSGIRQSVFPDAPQPAFEHQVVWRATLERPASICRYSMFFGPRTKAGINPISQDELYILLVQNADDDVKPEPELLPAMLRELLGDFGGSIAELRDLVVDPEMIDYRPLESLLVPRPWCRDRVVLVGDAAHAAMPHLASGAGMAIEDGIVLAEELGRGAGPVEQALERFMERRWERCRMVVENSLQLSRWERDPDAIGADPGGLTNESFRLLALPF